VLNKSNFPSQPFPVLWFVCRRLTSFRAIHLQFFARSGLSKYFLTVLAEAKVGAYFHFVKPNARGTRLEQPQFSVHVPLVDLVTWWLCNCFRLYICAGEISDLNSIPIGELIDRGRSNNRIIGNCQITTSKN
jgi:hypothetical protein